MVIRMMNELNENINSMKHDIGIIKKNWSQIKIIISEKKNTLEGINNRLDETEDEINIFEQKVAENAQSEQQNENGIKKEDRKMAVK